MRLIFDGHRGSGHPATDHYENERSSGNEPEQCVDNIHVMFFSFTVARGRAKHALIWKSIPGGAMQQCATPQHPNWADEHVGFEPAPIALFEDLRI